MNSPRTFSCEHGDPGRRSRVDAEPRTYRAFERLVLPPDEVERWPIRPHGPILAMALDPSGQRVLARLARQVIVLQPYGVRQHLSPESGDWAMLATDDGLVYGPSLHPWGGEPAVRLASRALLADTEARTQLTMAMDARRWICAVALAPTWDADSIGIESRRQQDGEFRTAWRARLPDHGQAAIDDAGRVAVLTRAGLHIYSADGADEQGRPACVIPVPTTRYAVGAASPGWLVLSANDREPLVPADHSKRSGLRPGQCLQQRWHTTVQAWRSDGTPAWQATVPFEVHQPPIERPDGTVVVVGRGLAAIADGAVRWHRAFESPAAATAFGDGRLALVEGSRLRVLDTQGQPQQTLDVPHAEPLITQPAVAPDGTVYVATPSRMYAVR